MRKSRIACSTFSRVYSIGTVIHIFEHNLSFWEEVSVEGLVREEDFEMYDSSFGLLSSLFVFFSCMPSIFRVIVMIMM